MYYGAIEAGGTKFVVSVLDEKMNILVRESIKTEHPDVTLPKVMDVFKEYELVSLGIGSFGPVDLNTNSKTYGYITSTPKKGWNNFDLVGYFKSNLNIPIGFDTDVNAAAYSELHYGAAKGLSNCVYITVGTGIGAGVVVDGKMVHGLTHPEVGHVYVRKHKDDNFDGVCPYHGDCLEGLAAGPALEKRWNTPAINLDENHIAWDFESYYMAQVIVNLILTVSPQKVILGGGVMHQEHLIKKIKKDVNELLNEYIDSDLFDDEFIQTPGLGDNAGLFGAYKLAIDARGKN